MILYNINIQMEEPKIKVVIRKRPLSRKEIHRGDLDIVHIQKPDTILIH